MDRTERVVLVAQISNYLAGMEKARQATEKTATAAQKLASQREAMNGLGLGMLGLGTAFAAGLAVVVAKTAEFDARMSQVKTLAHATRAEMSDLSDAALHLGQAIGFSASQVADAEIELVKAGVSVKDQLGGGLVGTLNLAAAGQLDVADATQIAASAMTQFALQGKDVPHVADLLAAGADKALGSVQDLGNGLKFVGPVAHSMGVSLDATVGTLALFAQNGILGEQAGTGLRGVLLSLTSPSKLASDVMKEYGINLYDAQGKFIGLAGTAEQLKKGLGGLTAQQRDQALGQIFGNQQITEATLLMQGGAKEVNKWTKAVNDQGFAAEQAAGKMDNLKGDLSKLSAAFETDIIQSGTGANAVLRDVTQVLTEITKVVGSVPQPVLELGVALTGVAGTFLLVGGAALTAIPKYAAYKDALKELTLSGRSVGVAIGGITTALTIGASVLGLWASAQADAQAHVDEFEQSLDQATGQVTKSTREIAKSALATGNSWGWLINQSTDSPYQSARKLGLSLDTVTDAALGNKKALAEVNKATLANLDPIKQHDQYYAVLAKNAKAAGLSESDYALAATNVARAVNGEAASLANGKQAFKDKKDADDSATESQNNLAATTFKASKAYLDAAISAGNLTSQITQLIDTINKANGVGQDAVSANADYRKALDDATQSVKEYVAQHGKSAAALDENTEAGSANAEMLSDLAKKGQDAAQAQFALDGNTDAYIQRLKDTRSDVIQRAQDIGGTADQVQNLADRVAALPSDKEIQVIAQTGAATKAVQDYKDFLASLPSNLTTRFDAKFSADARGYGSANGNVFDHARAFANGGFPTGIYSGGVPLYKFAEPETRWEAFISGRPGQETRNRKIWAEAGQRLGVPNAWVPATYSPSPYPASAGSGAQAPVAFPDTVTLVDANGSILGHMDVKISQSNDRTKTAISTGKQKGAF